MRLHNHSSTETPANPIVSWTKLQAVYARYMSYTALCKSALMHCICTGWCPPVYHYPSGASQSRQGLCWGGGTAACHPPRALLAHPSLCARTATLPAQAATACTVKTGSSIMHPTWLNLTMMSKILVNFWTLCHETEALMLSMSLELAILASAKRGGS